MSDVLEFRSWSGVITDEFGSQHCIFTAVIDDMVQTVPATYFSPAEFGPALCRGTYLLNGEEGEIKPEELVHYVDGWMPIDE